MTLDLVPDEEEFICGQAPRTIHTSLDGNTFFVGCKDGSIVVLNGLADEGLKTKALAKAAFRPVTMFYPSPRAGVRTICPLDDNRILIGRNDGNIDLLNWRRALKKPGDGSPESVCLDEETPIYHEKDDPVTYIGWLDQTYLIISYKNGGTRVIHKESLSVDLTQKGDSLLDKTLGINGICFLARIGSDSTDENPVNNRWLLFTQTGDMWSVVGNPLNPELKKTDFSTKKYPGFFLDFALKNVGSSSVHDMPFDIRKPVFGVYVATDIGIYLIQGKPTQPSSEGDLAFTVQRILLPELANTCMAITYYHHGTMSDQRLWVSDAEGNSYLYTHPAPAEGSGDLQTIENWRLSHWRRFPIHPVSSQVLRASASWQPLAGTMVVCQTRRNDRIVISRYYENSTETSLLNKLLYWQGNFNDWRELLDEYFSNSIDAESHPEELFADLLQKARETDKDRTILLDFIHNPKTDLAIMLLDQIVGEYPKSEGAKEPIETALELWTYTLMGIIHRSTAANRHRLFLGLVRWLVSIKRGVGTTTMDESHKHIVAKAAEDNIAFVRKYGIFGASFHDRFSMSQVIDAPVIHPQEPGLDQLLFKAIRFQRIFDPVIKYPAKKDQGKTARDLCTFSIPYALNPPGAVAGAAKEERKFIAVSWSRGGIEVFEVNRAQNGKPPCLIRNFHLEPRENQGDWNYTITTEQTANVPPEGPDSNHHGYSRSILIGRIEDPHTRYLLASPIHRPNLSDPNSSPREKLLFFNLEIDDKGLKPKASFSLSLDLHDSDGNHYEESVYSLLELEPGLVMVGLRGKGGRARVVLVGIDWNETKNALEARILLMREGPDGSEPAKDQFLPGVAPERKIIARNQVWSLAIDPGTASRNHHTVMAGCDDGQIWRIIIRKPKNSQDRNAFTWEIGLVERLGVPVHALAYREEIESGTDPRIKSRVFAGCTDGTIVALQELSEGEKTEKGQARIDPIFGMLWATQEQDPVVRIHRFFFKLGPEHREPLILAVTETGLAVLFSDLPEIPATVTGGHGERKHQRRPIPGQRYGRLNVGENIFASGILTWPGNNPDDNPARLAVATNDGNIKILQLSHPPNSKIRGQEFINIVKELLNIAGKRPRSRLQLAEALYGSCPSLSLSLVRCLVGPLKEEDPDQNELRIRKNPWSLYRPWLPLHLRPLLDFHDAWKSRNTGAIKGKLAEALRLAQRLDDMNLFQEIIVTVLNRTNHHLFDLAGQHHLGKLSLADAQAEREIYLSILDEQDQARYLWVGLPNRIDIRADMVFAKNMVDGEAMWRIALMSRHSQEIGSDPVIFDQFKDMLARRITAVRQFLVRGNPLLSLETLRATSLSLIRASKRLADARSKGWNPGAFGHEMPWSGFKGFFDTVGDFAARVSHSERGLSVALAHEISRCFALGSCISPSASIQIAHRVAEAGLPDELIGKIKRQFELLSALGIHAPQPAIKLFNMALEKKWSNGLTFTNQDLINLIKSPGPTQPLPKAVHINDSELHLFAGIEGRIGQENSHVLNALWPYDQAVRRLQELTEQLTGNARLIDLGFSTALLKLIKNQHNHWHKQNEGETYPYFHTHNFWVYLLENLVNQLKSKKLHQSKRANNVRPEIILFCRDLERSCQDWLEELKQSGLEYRLFEPERTILLELIGQLREAAGKFPKSAAIQQNIVLGVLGHGLLESLDLHVMGLGEVSQALEPLLFSKLNDDEKLDLKDQPQYPTAHRFARYLLLSSQKAESIPKNLRTLKGLLEDSEMSEGPSLAEYSEGKRQTISLKGLMEKIESAPDRKWQEQTGTNPVAECFLNPTEARYLGLTLKELAQNNKIYGLQSALPTFELVEVGGEEPYQGARITFFFRAAAHGSGPVSLTPGIWTEPVKDRLDRLKESGLQTLFEPHPDRTISSHGTGLYLANLAAAVADWQLLIETIDIDKPNTNADKLVFLLKRGHSQKGFSAATDGEIS